MNKKGFTLIELLVSIVLLSIIMLFMTNFIFKVKDEKGDVENDYNISLMIVQNEMTALLNNDAISKGGIDAINISSEIEDENIVDNREVSYGNGEKYIIDFYVVDNAKYYLRYYKEGETEKTIKYLEGSTGGSFMTSTDEDFEYLKILTIKISDNPDYNIKVYSKK